MNTKTLCLAVLSLGKASGYDIGKRLENPFGHFVDVSRSGVYPVLKCMEEEGLVQYEDIEQSALPNKKIYELTDKGRDLLKAELDVLPPVHKIRSQFMLLLFFAEMLSPQRLETILKERVQEVEYFLQEESNIRKSVAGNKGQEFMLDYVVNKAIAEKECLEKNSGEFMERLKTEAMEKETSYE
jgi:DNA-binding PadR family transcriptional regulator